MSTGSKLSMNKLLVTSHRFTAHNSKPKEGKGFINFHFEDNRKDCLCEPNGSICWQATLTVKAFSGTGSQPDPANDLLLMEAVVSVDAEFTAEKLDSTDSLQSFAWYFDDTCKRKLLSKMKLLLLDTEFANVPLPNNP